MITRKLSSELTTRICAIPAARLRVAFILLRNLSCTSPSASCKCEADDNYGPQRLAEASSRQILRDVASQFATDARYALHRSVSAASCPATRDQLSQASESYSPKNRQDYTSSVCTCYVALSSVSNILHASETESLWKQHSHTHTRTTDGPACDHIEQRHGPEHLFHSTGSFKHVVTALFSHCGPDQADSP